jgi:hypothetical protein
MPAHLQRRVPRQFLLKVVPRGSRQEVGEAAAAYQQARGSFQQVVQALCGRFGGWEEAV